MRLPLKSLSAALLATVFLALPATQSLARTHTAAAPVTIKVAFQQYGPPPYRLTQWWQQVKQQVEAANPNIKVQLMPIVASEGDYYTKIDLMLRSASTAPDLIYEDSFLIGSDATAGYLQPLDSYLASWPEYKAQWFPSMQQITTFNGHNYGVMNGTDVRLIWYNKSVLKKAGLPANWQPKNWNDILAAAQQIKKKEPGVIPLNVYSGIPEDEASTMQGFEMFLFGTPDKAHLYDYKTNKWVVSSKGELDTLNFLAKVYDPTNLLGPTNDIALSTETYVPIHTGLTTGKVGIDVDGSWISGDWQPGGFAATKGWQNLVGYAKMPTEFGQAPHYITMSGGWSFAIASKSQHKDQAFAVLKVANSRANLGYYDTIATQVATRKDVETVPSYKNLPLSSFMTQLVSFTQFRPGFPAYPRISNQIDLAMENVMSGTKPQDALADFQQAVTGIAGPGNVETLP